MMLNKEASLEAWRIEQRFEFGSLPELLPDFPCFCLSGLSEILNGSRNIPGVIERIFHSTDAGAVRLIRRLTS